MLATFHLLPADDAADMSDEITNAASEIALL